MHRVPGRVRFEPYRDNLAQTAPCQSQTHRSAATNYPKNHSRWVNQPVDVSANSINRYSPHHAFPIGTAKPTRLPPWEDFQRGPQAVHAETLHPGPHQKSFTKPAVRPVIGMLRVIADLSCHCKTSDRGSWVNSGYNTTLTFLFTPGAKCFDLLATKFIQCFYVIYINLLRVQNVSEGLSHLILTQKMYGWIG
jgi:hypothetical protein